MYLMDGKLLTRMQLYSGVLHIVGFDAFAWMWVLRVGEGDDAAMGAYVLRCLSRWDWRVDG